MKKSTPFLLGLLAFALYFFTGSRSIQWQDSGQFTLRIGTGDLMNYWGLAMVHPLHYHLGRIAMRLMPWNIPWAITAVSALGGAVAVGGVFAAVRKWTENATAACYAAGCLMLAHTFWRFSGLPEVYTLSAALLILQMLCYLYICKDGKTWAWIPLMGLNGLNFANHNLALLELAVWGLLFLHAWCKGTLSHRQAFAAIGLWILGSLPYTSLILVTMFVQGEFWPVVQSALFGHSFAEQVMAVRPTLTYTFISLAFLALSFPNFSLPFAGWAAWRERKSLAPLLAVLAMHLIFVLRYDVIDQYTFLIPAFAGLAFFAGIGFHQINRPAFRKLAFLLLALQPILYGIAPTLARKTDILATLNFERNKPYRDDADYLFHPWTFRETSASRVARDAVEAAHPDGAIVIVDHMASYAVHWTLHTWESPHEITVLRPGDQEELLAVLSEKKRAVWMPASTLDEIPDGWTPKGKILINLP
ncbi:MAG: DUF2723 domain-containing protein [Verrucomicrobia bacterium]|nr:DUF2723 domain-containing protein [Verrucomicrobiota bacterium]MCH8511357.1 DUF2723 domain-containing protein [Kiritimatiellia bacterium]